MEENFLRTFSVGRVVPFVKLKRGTRSVSRSSTLAIQLSRRSWMIQSSQRRSEACRICVVLFLLRLSAFEPFDRSWMVPRVSLRRGVLAMAGLRSVRWRAERATKQREKHGSDDCHRTSDLAPPRAGPSPPGDQTHTRVPGIPAATSMTP